MKHRHPVPPEPPALPQPEFSRPIPAESLPRDHLTLEIEASPGECQALAARFDLIAIGRLRATVRLKRVDGGRMVRVRGTLEAEVVQTCVATLEPVPARVTETFGALFAPESLLPRLDGELVLDPLADDEDSPEPMVGGVIDIGELTAQHLSLALDPYPRLPGLAPVELLESMAEDEPVTTTPFAPLADLKQRH